MKTNSSPKFRPAILAPAGNRDSFLAALAAQADAVYCGLKLFSARMEAKNFTLPELASLVELAHARGTRVYVALNTLLKTDELPQAAVLIDELKRFVKPDALIIQDLALLPLIKLTGFKGDIHLSTLANATFSQALALVRKKLGITHVVLPRELNIDEIKTMAESCPSGLNLEVFVHGALCYGVSGRCYWSSYLGGKSGLRGRCVQPCRRVFQQGGDSHRFFSCQDLSLDVLAKILLAIPEISTWKIEGRKKGPHYVYYTVSAYRLLRDHGGDPQAKKDALALLERALGRPGTHYHMLPQRPQNPVNLKNQTGSGLMVGRIKGGRHKSFIAPREELYAGDRLRIGYEDEPGHATIRLGRSVPGGGRYAVKSPGGPGFAKGMPVFLTDRREPSLAAMLDALAAQLPPEKKQSPPDSNIGVHLPVQTLKQPKSRDLFVYRRASNKQHDFSGLWLSPELFERRSPVKEVSQVSWWLPPVIWPEEEQAIQTLINTACRMGARDFVLNAPWQVALIPDRSGKNLWAGPFCNLANPLALATAANLGFGGAIVSPEMDRDSFLDLPRHSPIPLGVVIAGNWPLCVSRSLASEVESDKAFNSPKGEQSWVTRHQSNFWVYPNWAIDLSLQKEVLEKRGYSLFVHLVEPVPREVKMKKRQGQWNWKIKLR